MKEFNYTITDPQGVHARPAGVLVKEAANISQQSLLKKTVRQVTQREYLL